MLSGPLLRTSSARSAARWRTKCPVGGLLVHEVPGQLAAKRIR